MKKKQITIENIMKSNIIPELDWNNAIIHVQIVELECSNGSMVTRIHTD